MVKAAKAVVAPTQRKKRAKAFTRPELVEIVRFLDANTYGLGQRGEIQKRKSQLMHELSIILYNTFGTKHCLRQVQKRYSDLKVRQKKTLEAIRQQLKRENKSLTIEKTEDNEGPSEAAMRMSELSLQEKTNDPVETEYFTIHLETIPENLDNVVASVSTVESHYDVPTIPDPTLADSNLHALEERMIQHLQALESRLSAKIDNLDKCSQNYV